MSGTTKPQDLVIGTLGADYLNSVRILLGGSTAVTKGDTVRVTLLTFAARGEPRTGTIERAAHGSNAGVLFLASHDADVDRMVTCVRWLPMQMDTTGATKHDPVYLAVNGRPSLTDPGGGVVLGSVVGVGTIAAGGSVLLVSPGVV